MRLIMKPFLLTSLIFCATFVSAAEIEFNRDIRPILSDTCWQCHGPDAQTREAGLRLDDEQAAKADAGGYAAIVAGDPDNSEAMRRILSDDPDEMMPPPASGLKWTAEQKELFRRWIAEGAVYETHWSFTRIERPHPPSDEHPIDAFIRDRLRQAGLAPAPLASPETQLRRVTLDLTGLPPSISEIDAFLADIQQRGMDAAYECVVDRLLSSARHAEQMTWHWLEAARYADTDGYQNDGPREMWRWRDWVVAAFAQGMPFDQFTIEQLAGDLLPDATDQQLIASGFNRNNRYNSEEGIPIDEFLLENAVDRVDTTSTIWMGLTVGCARCHDHKYDPISQREYYQLIDYFNDVAESGRARREGNSEPWIKTPTPDQQQQLDALKKRVRQAARRLKKTESEIARAQADWEHEVRLSGPILTDGLDHYYSFDDEDERVKPIEGGAVLSDGVRGNAATLNGEGYFELDKILGLIGNGRFSIAFWMKPDDVQHGPILSNETLETQRKGIAVEFVEGRLRWNINTRWIGGVSTIETNRLFKPGRWVHITLTNDGTQRAAGMQIYVDGKAQDVSVIRNTNSNQAPRGIGSVMRVGFSKHIGHWKGQLDELRFYTQRTLSAAEAAQLAVRRTVEQIAARAEELRSPHESALIRTAFLEQAAVDQHAKLLAQLRAAQAAQLAWEDQLPTTMIMRDLPEGRPSFVRNRGVYDQLGERVEQNVPAALPPLPREQPNDRLAFARWLVSAEHPLTARVTVNRYWQIFFGDALVKTPEDFGSQGDLPTHRELLDWLAAEFIQHDWDNRHLIKRIVSSQTYRQDSAVRPEHYRIDPENRLLARAPRLSLHGNVLRDQALFAAGLLVEKTGGPSVFPYQPAGMWEEASNAKYRVGKGEQLYRRSLYTYWKRTLAPPTLAVLDTADREYCSVKPKRTNTPLQALTLLNDVTFIEAARKLGERLLSEGGDSDAERIRFAFRTVATREPTDRELTVLADAWNAYRGEFAGAAERAVALMATGDSPSSDQYPPTELAAAATLANVLLNLEEVTTRE